MLTVTLIITIICGALLCFAGYRLFRFAMALAGFAIGAGIGFFIYNLVSDRLPSSGNGIWVMVFMGVGGLLLGMLSFSIYKAALFYISAFITTFLVLKTYLLVTASGVGVSAFVQVALGKTKLDGATDKISEIRMGEGSTVGKTIEKALERLPGSTNTEKFFALLVAALVAGIIVGVVVCLIQKPAIIVITAVMGGILISQSAFSMIDSIQDFDASAKALVSSFASGSGQPALSSILAIALIGLGIIFQFKTAKQEK